MTDRPEIPIETTEGQRGSGSFGDRLMVGVALIALLGGVFIVAGKALNRSDPVAVASASPRVSAVASRGPTPTPAPAVFTVEPGTVPDLAAPPPSAFSGWIRALVDVPVLEAPSLGANQIGGLAQGEAALADQVPSASVDGITWLQLGTGPSAGGVVAATNGSRRYVRQYEAPPSPYGAGVNGVVAGPDQFVVFGYTEGSQARPQRPFLLASADGAKWEAVDLAVFGKRVPDAVAHGPAGWLAVANVQSNDGTNGAWLWSSTDALHWRSEGLMAGAGGAYVVQMAGNATGYEIVLGGDGRRPRGWYSRDGLTWMASQPSLTGDFYRLAALRTGFYAWSQDRAAGQSAAFSLDGLRWAPVSGGPTGVFPEVVGVDDGLLTIDHSPVTGLPRVWVASAAAGTFEWRQLPDQDAFRGAGVSMLASDGSRVIAFGWERSDLKPMVWFGDGADWERAELPADAFGDALPLQVAANTHGAVAVGYRPSLQAENPTLWRATTRMTWSEVTVPELTAVGEATRTGCPSRPRDSLEFVVLPAPK
ncbi:MAG: hypothetical protein ACXWL8_02920, partial [Candidatus Limnocylindria bacterium]